MRILVTVPDWTDQSVRDCVFLKTMKVLGVDYGQKKIGLSVGDTETRLAEPHSVIRFETRKEAIEKVAKVVKVEEVGKVVVGISEGKMGRESKNFSLSLRERLEIPVETFDETLTTREAQKLAIEAGINRKKRRQLEDAYSATLILQDYLDFKGK